MKKLMTMVGAATMAFGLFAAEGLTLPLGASMDSEEGYTVDTGIMAAGMDSNWVTDAESDESLIKAYEESEALPHPSEIFWTTQDQYLHVEAEQPLYRAIATPTGTTTDCLVPVDIATAERDGIIIDQLVKFSAFDAETEKIDVEAGAKIAVWVKAGEEDDTKGTLQITTAALDRKFATAETNIDTKIVVDTAKWHQLKIKTIKAAEIDETYVPGFTIQIDDTVLDCATDLFPTYDGYTPEAQKLIDEGKLFPSMVAWTDSAASTLFGVAYKGTGEIDDVAVSAYVPPAPTTYTLAVTEPKEEEGTLTTDPEAGQIAAGTEVTVTATPAEGYELESITTNGQVLVGITFEMPAENVTVAATFKKVSYPEDWPEADPEVAAKFAEWSTGPGEGADLSTDAAKNAFLLNVSVDDYEASNDLTIKSIDVDAEGYAAIEVSIPGNYGFPGIDLAEINGILHIEAGNALDQLEKKAVVWWFTENGNAISKVKYNFIKAVIGFETPEVDAVTKEVGGVEE